MSVAMDGSWFRSRADRIRARAKKIAAGEKMSARETAKLLSDAAYEIDKVAWRWDRLNGELDQARAWRQGFETARTIKESPDAAR